MGYKSVEVYNQKSEEFDDWFDELPILILNAELDLLFPIEGMEAAADLYQNGSSGTVSTQYIL